MPKCSSRQWLSTVTVGAVLATAMAWRDVNRTGAATNTDEVGAARSARALATQREQGADRGRARVRGGRCRRRDRQDARPADVGCCGCLAASR
jgi:hypothetical protein